MKKQIVSVSPLQTGKLFAVFYFLVSLPLVGMTSILFLFSPRPTPGIGFLIMFQVLYLALGFAVSVAGARLYNIAAEWVGGIEYTSRCIDCAEHPETLPEAAVMAQVPER